MNFLVESELSSLGWAEICVREGGRIGLDWDGRSQSTGTINKLKRKRFLSISIVSFDLASKF